MRAAVLVADADAIPEDWVPLTNMLEAACEEYVVLCAAEIQIPAGRPRHDIERSDELTALKQALVWSREEPVLLISSELRAPSAELARYLEYIKAGYDAVVPMIDQQTCQPLFAIYTGACVSHINSALLSGKFAINDLLDELAVRYVEPSEVAKFGEAAVVLSRSG